MSSAAPGACADYTPRGGESRRHQCHRLPLPAWRTHAGSGALAAGGSRLGVAEPSRADELLTQALKQALALVDVRTLDHFVVAGARLVSLAERGLV